MLTKDSYLLYSFCLLFLTRPQVLTGMSTWSWIEAEKAHEWGQGPSPWTLGKKRHRNVGPATRSSTAALHNDETFTSGDAQVTEIRVPPSQDRSGQQEPEMIQIRVVPESAAELGDNRV